MIDTILSFFSTLWQSVIDFLPGSPFTAFIASMERLPYLSILNWFFPVSEVIAVLELWLTAVALYYVYQAIMRFVHIL